MSDRTDRVLALLADQTTLEEAVAAGVTLQDAEDALAIVALDLELARAEPQESVRGLVEEFLRRLDGR